MVLQKRLEKELEEKILPETQTGFRRGKNTIDNIFILNYIANREIQKGGGKMHAFFADLRTAFGKIDRDLLNKILEKKGLERLRRRIGEIYEETKNVVRVNGEISKEF